MTTSALHYYPACDDFDTRNYPDSDRLENRQGDIMYVARLVDSDTLEEVDMSINTNQPLTLGWAIGLCISTVIAVIFCAGGVYLNLQSDIKDVRSDVITSRDKASDGTESLRSDTRSDVAGLRTDINSGIDKLDAKLVKLDSDITSIKTDIATIKAKQEAITN